jgi:glutathione S-transferase
LKRYLDEKNGSLALNPLDKSDRRWVASRLMWLHREIWSRIRKGLPALNFFNRFLRFQKLLDCEMKKSTREGVGMANFVVNKNWCN